MFVEGGDPLDVPVESLTVIPSSDLERREGEPCGAGQGHSPPIVGRGYANRRLPENQLPLRPSRPVAARSHHPPHSHTPNPHPGLPSPETEELKPILVTLDYLQLDTDTPAPPATRELQVGCIRTTQLSPKKVTTALAQPGQPQPCPALPRWVWGGAGQPGPQPHCLQCRPPTSSCHAHRWWSSAWTTWRPCSTTGSRSSPPRAPWSAARPRPSASPGCRPMTSM